MCEFQSKDIGKLAEALLRIQSNMNPALKDGTNPFTNSTYATLNSVMATCRDLLFAEGILLTQLMVPAPVELGTGHIGLETKFIHVESGQWLSSLAVIPLPKNDPQGMGSAITYARRYALTAMLGMVTEDDDGESAKISPKMGFRPNNAPESTQRQKGPQRKQTQATANLNGSNRLQTRGQNLPRLEGIEYQSFTAQDGKTCIVARGNTMSKKEILMEAGFRWNRERKCWWKYDIAM